MSTGRREFLKYLGTAAAANAFPASIARALAIPANNSLLKNPVFSLSVSEFWVIAAS
jgi:hypothetical protein